MPADADLVARIRSLLPDLTVGAVREQKMFGAVSFMVDDALAISAANGGGVLVKTHPGEFERLIVEDHVEPMSMGSQVSDSWVRVAAAGVQNEADLLRWIRYGLSVVANR